MQAAAHGIDLEADLGSKALRVHLAEEGLPLLVDLRILPLECFRINTAARQPSLEGIRSFSRFVHTVKLRLGPSA